MGDDIDPIVKQLIGLLSTQLKEQNESTRKTLFWSFTMMALLMVANAGLSGVNLALEAYGMTVGTVGTHAEPEHLVMAPAPVTDTDVSMDELVMDKVEPVTPLPLLKPDYLEESEDEIDSLKAVGYLEE